MTHIDTTSPTVAAWREYLIEGALLGLFLCSACTVLLGYPSGLLHGVFPDAFSARVFAGVAMGLTAIGLIRSPWGKQSGAHMNPAVTLTFAVLGKVAPGRALGYMAGQFAGAILGVLTAWILIGAPLAHYQVNFAVTAPGVDGPGAAFWAEVVISFLMMSMVLWTSNSKRFARWTPYGAATLVALFITFENPYSGMSMNPARTFGSAFAAGQWQHLWVYFAAPPLGMLAAATVYKLLPGARRVYCAKLDHHGHQRCLFRCQYGDLDAE